MQNQGVLRWLRVAVVALLASAALSGFVLATPVQAAGCCQMTLTSSANPSNAGDAVTFTATGTFACADGGVTQFSVDNGPVTNVITPQSENGPTSVTWSTTFSSPGQYTVWAQFSAANYNCNDSVNLTQTVESPPPPPPPPAPATDQPSPTPTDQASSTPTESPSPIPPATASAPRVASSARASGLKLSQAAMAGIAATVLAAAVAGYALFASRARP